MDWNKFIFWVSPTKATDCYEFNSKLENFLKFIDSKFYNVPIFIITIAVNIIIIIIVMIVCIIIKSISLKAKTTWVPYDRWISH